MHLIQAILWGVRQPNSYQPSVMVIKLPSPFIPTPRDNILDDVKDNTIDMYVCNAVEKTQQ